MQCKRTMQIHEPEPSEYKVVLLPHFPCATEILHNLGHMPAKFVPVNGRNLNLK
jgi:hypothetical protein